MDRFIFLVFCGVALLAFGMLIITVGNFLTAHYDKAIRAWISCAFLTCGAVLLVIYLRKKG